MKSRIFLFTITCFVALLLHTKTAFSNDFNTLKNNKPNSSVSSNTPPVFVGGTTQSLTICQNTTSVSIDAYLTINDPDIGQSLTWTVGTSPLHGTVHGFPGNATTNGANVQTGGYSYTPFTGFSGADSFYVTISDGFSTAQTKIVVNINSSTILSTIKGNTSICAGKTTLLSDSTAGGTWSSATNSVATIDANTGLVTSLAAGSSLITYTITSSSGCISTTTTTLNVVAYPTVPAITAANNAFTVCVGAINTFSNTTQGGIWSIYNQTYATIDSLTGIVTGLFGANGGGSRDTIYYTVTNSTGCSTTTKSAITVYARPSINGITPNNPGVCVGNTVQLSNTTGGGVWSSLNTSVASISTSGLVTGITLGSATIDYKVTNNRGCAHDTTVVVTVSTPPTVAAIKSATNTTTLCIGGTTTLTDATSGGVWSSSNTGVATVSSTGVVTALNTGSPTIYYTVTNSSGCSKAVSYSITIRAAPAVDQIAGSTTACVGSQITLTENTGGGTWSVSNTKLASINTNGVLTGIAPGTDTVYYNVTNGSGCSSNSSLVVTIVTNVTVSPITGTSSICSGTTTQLSDSTKNGTWSSSDQSVAYISATGLLLGRKGGTTTITYTVSSGSTCSATATVVATIYQVPNVPPISGTTSVCLGNTSQLSNSTTGGFWISSDNSIATISQTGLVTSLKVGSPIITYTVTGDGGCVQSVTSNFTVNALPTVSKIVGTNALCKGATNAVLFTDSTAGGVWSSGDTAIAAVDSLFGIVTGVKGGNTAIYYTVKNGNLCTNSASLVLTINDSTYVAPIKGSSSICAGTTTTLTDSTTGGIWASTNNKVATITSAGLVTAVATTLSYTSISYTVTDGCGTKSAYLSFTINPSPNKPGNININGAFGGSICVARTATASDNTTGGTWSSSDPNIASISTGGTITGVSAGSATIYYTVKNTYNCTNSNTSSISVVSFNPLPNIVGASSVCVGNSTTYTNTTNGVTWTSSNTTVATVSSTGVVKGISAGTSVITCSLTGGGPCARTASQTITVNPLPIVAPISGSTTICVNAYTLLTDATSSGVWSSKNSSIATINTYGLVRGVSNGSDSIFYTVTDGTTSCKKDTFTILTINALPVIPSINGNNGICLGKTTQLSNTLSGGIWSITNSKATITSTGLVKGISIGIDTVRYKVTNSNNCSDSVFTTVTINSLPVIKSITGNAPICVGKLLVLSDSTNGGTWTSASPSIATINTSGVVTGISAGIDSVRYIVTNGNACTDSVSIGVLVNPLPVIGQITGANPVCVGKTTQLLDTSLNGVWSSYNTSIASVSSTGLLTGLIPGSTTITYTVTNLFGCADSVSVFDTVNTLPVIKPIKGYSTLCVKNTITLTDSTLNGTWVSSNPAIATINALGLVTGISSGNVIIRYIVTNIYGCTDSVSFSLTVNDLPVISTIQGNSPLCAGKTFQFVDTTSSGSWSSTNTNVATINASGFVTAIKTGVSSIRYIVSNSNGCIDSVSYSLTVNPLPIITPIVGNSNICIGKTNQLSDTSKNGLWVSTNSTVATINNSGLVSSFSFGNTTVKYIVTNNYGCTDSVQKVQTVNSTPIIGAITGSTTICAASTTTLSDTTKNGAWVSSNQSILAINGLSGLATGLTAGTTIVKYIVTNTAGCTDSVSTNFTVNPKPVIGAISGSSTLCFGKTTQLSDTTIGGSWISSNTSVATISSIGQITTVSSGVSTIYYKLTNAYSCADSASLSLTINSLPVITQIKGANNVCVGSSITLTNSTAGGVWSSIKTSIATISNLGVVTGVSASASDTIRYTVTNSKGCVDSISFPITVNALPTVSSIQGNSSFLCVNSLMQLSNSTSGGIWSGNSFASISSQGLVKGLFAGIDTIKYTVTNTNLCSNFSSYILTINTLPVIAPISIGSTSLCLGKSTTISELTTGGIWVNSNSKIATISSNLLTANQVGIDTIKYIVTNSNNCSDSVFKIVTVNALPILAPITGITKLCVGNNTLLNDTTLNGVWSSTDVTVAKVSATGFVTALKQGVTTIKYIVTNSSGCSDSSTISFTVNGNPNIGLINGASVVCLGTTPTFSDTTANGNWFSTDNNIATISSTGNVTPISIGIDTIKYTVSNSNGCTSTSILAISVNTVSTPIASYNNPVALGDTIKLAATSINNAVYNWFGPNGFTSNVQNPQLNSATALMSGTYSVSATANGCTSTQSIVVVSVNTFYTVSGHVANPSGTIIPTVTLNITGTSASISSLDSYGNYTLPLSIGGNFTITPTKNNDIKKSNGVSTIDIALIQSHILQKTLLSSPYKLIAADVDNNGSINTIDIVYIKRLILGLDSTFKGNRLWAFVDSSFVFSNPAKPFPHKDSISYTGLSTNKSNQSFIGMKLGDVNWDWNASIARTNTNYTTPIEFYYNDVTVGSNNLVRIPIRVRNLNQILGMQFTLNFNNDLFEYVTLENNILNADFTTNFVREGSIPMLWNNPSNNLITMSDGDVIFELVLRKKDNAIINNESLNIDSKITSVEAYDGNKISHLISKKEGVINDYKKEFSVNIASISNESAEVSPNPTTGVVNIKVLSSKEKLVYLELSDNTGRLILNEKVDLTAGANYLNLNLQKRYKLNSGMYYLKFIGLNNEISKRIVIVN